MVYKTDITSAKEELVEILDPKSVNEIRASLLSNPKNKERYLLKIIQIFKQHELFNVINMQLYTSKRQADKGYRSTSSWIQLTTAPLNAFFYLPSESGWISNAIDRLVLNYKNSNPDWESYSYTYLIAAKTVTTNTSLGMYYTVICHNRPYPPSLTRDKEYADVGKELETFKMHFMYPFLKPIAQNQVTTDLKTFSTPNYSNTTYSYNDDYIRVHYPQPSAVPRFVTSMTELESLSTSEGYTFVKIVYDAPVPLYPFISQPLTI